MCSAVESVVQHLYLLLYTVSTNISSLQLLCSKVYIQQRCALFSYMWVQVRYLEERQTFAPEQVTAMMLTKLKEVAETYLKTKVVDCVISVCLPHITQLLLVLYVFLNYAYSACRAFGFQTTVLVVLYCCSSPKIFSLAFLVQG